MQGASTRPNFEPDSMDDIEDGGSGQAHPDVPIQGSTALILGSTRRADGQRLKRFALCHGMICAANPGASANPNTEDRPASTHTEVVVICADGAVTGSHPTTATAVGQVGEQKDTEEVPCCSCWPF